MACKRTEMLHGSKRGTPWTTPRWLQPSGAAPLFVLLTIVVENRKKLRKMNSHLYWFNGGQGESILFRINFVDWLSDYNRVLIPVFIYVFTPLWIGWFTGLTWLFANLPCVRMFRWCWCPVNTLVCLILRLSSSAWSWHRVLWFTWSSR
jgi:hypothetical protein